MTTDEIRARTADILARAAAERTRATAEDAWPLPDPVAQWKADADRRTAEHERARAEFAAASKPAPFDWSAFDDRIQQALAVERRFMAEVLGEEIGKLLNEERKDVMREAREELRELRVEAARLGSQIAELRAQLTIDRSKPVDMPSPLSRRVN